MIVSSTQEVDIRREDIAYYDPNHREPHGSASTEPISHEEVHNAPCKTTKVVNRDNDACQAVVGI